MTQGTDAGGKRVDAVSIDTWLDVCLSDVHAAIEARLPTMAGSRLETRSLLEGVLGYTPPPELVEALKQVAEAPEDSALRMGLGRVLIATAILLRRELCALTEPRRLDPEMLRRQSEALPALLRRVQGLEEDIRSMPAMAGAGEADRLRRLRVTLMPPLSRLQGHAALVAHVRRLAEAGTAGSLVRVEGLSQAEVAWFEAAVGRGDRRETLAPRVLLDAVALRTGLARDLAAHWRGEQVAGQLRGDGAAYDLVVERLQAEERAAAAAGHDALARRLSTAQHELSRHHRKLAAILRGAGAAAPPPETGAGRRRRVALLGAVAVVAIGAALTVGALRGRDRAVAQAEPAAPPPAASDAPYTRLDRQGGILVGELHELAWRRMSPEQRHERIYALGVMAFGQGMREVRIVDGAGRELASWAQNGSIRIESP